MPDKTYDPLFLKALEGFVVIISADGDLVYLSENVNEYLGITQVKTLVRFSSSSISRERRRSNRFPVFVSGGFNG